MTIVVRRLKNALIRWDLANKILWSPIDTFEWIEQAKLYK